MQAADVSHSGDTAAVPRLPERAVGQVAPVSAKRARRRNRRAVRATDDAGRLHARRGVRDPRNELRAPRRSRRPRPDLRSISSARAPALRGRRGERRSDAGDGIGRRACGRRRGAAHRRTRGGRAQRRAASDIGAGSVDAQAPFFRERVDCRGRASAGARSETPLSAPGTAARWAADRPGTAGKFRGRRAVGGEPARDEPRGRFPARQRRGDAEAIAIAGAKAEARCCPAADFMLLPLVRRAWVRYADRPQRYLDAPVTAVRGATSSTVLRPQRPRWQRCRMHDSRGSAEAGRRGEMLRPVMSEDVVVELLQQVPLFANLPVGDLRIAARRTRSLTRAKGATIFDEGSPADCCYVITFGRAKVVLSGAEASEVILGTVEAHELVGELSLLDGSPRSAGLVALEECHLLWLPNAAFQELRNNRAFEDRLVVHVTAMLRRATEQLRAIYTYDSAERVAWCLARLAIRTGRRINGAMVISPRPPHQELADMTGCSRETVTRVLTHLQKSKSVSMEGESLTLSDSAFKRYLEIEKAACAGKDSSRHV